MGTSEAIRAEVFEHLAEGGAVNDVVDLVLSALEGDEALATAIDGGAVQRPEPLPPSDERVNAAVEGVYLTSLTVQGFRGIGPAATLTLAPGPGLTVVTGRNGSGKSSFAEALEVVLTGTAYRFGRSEAWKEGWRNIHRPDVPASVRLEVQLPGTKGPTRVERTWGDGRLDGSLATAQLPGEKRKSLGELGWDAALQSMRPFLTHGELESLLESRPSELHDRLGTVLGLGVVDDAITRLTAAAKSRDELVKQSERNRKALAEQLRSAEDERVQQAAALLRKRVVDLDALDALVSGAVGVDPSTSGLERLAELPPVDLDTTADLASRLRRAVEQLAELDTPEHRRADEVAELLDRALLAHRHRPETTCPICGTAEVLDDAWRARATDQRDQLRTVARELVARRREVRELLTDLRRLASLPVALLTRDVTVDEVEVGELAVTWRSWADGVPDDAEGVGVTDLVGVAERFEAAALEVQALREPIVGAAAAALERRDAVWRSVVGPLAAWLESARAAQAGAEAVTRVKQAEGWLKQELLRLKNLRLDPVRTRARQLWQLLRQQSNVDLSDIRFEGVTTHRRVTFDVLVDESQSQALGVMSQGELNALALAVYLPRSTHADSPFRFVVVDDPVQAMDPAKVDGLARVLEEVARDRQVLVFSHDPRLPDAVEHLGIAATVLRVERDLGSVVRVEPNTNPSLRLLSEARALRRDDDADDEVKRRVVPNLCRQALEHALAARYRRQQMTAGAEHVAVEQALDEANGLQQLAALTLLGDRQRGSEVYTTITNRHGRGATDIFRSVKEQGHGGAPNASGLADLVKGCDDLVGRLGAWTS